MQVLIDLLFRSADLVKLYSPGFFEIFTEEKERKFRTYLILTRGAFLVSRRAKDKGFR